MGVGGTPPSGKGVTREGSLANEGWTTIFCLCGCVCVLQVTLAYQSIVLYMCEGKVLMDKHFSDSYSVPFDNRILLKKQQPIYSFMISCIVSKTF